MNECPTAAPTNRVLYVAILFAPAKEGKEAFYKNIMQSLKG